MMLPAEIIRAKRDRLPLAEAQIQAFVRGLVDESWSEGQVAALAMAVLLNGMDRAECVALTRAMMHSGQVLRAYISRRSPLKVADFAPGDAVTRR